MKTLLTAFLLFCFTSIYAQQYDSTSTGEIPTSSLTDVQNDNLIDGLITYREGISSGAHCYFVFDDSGTYCRTSGTVTDYNVFGRRWAVVYHCTTGAIIAVWPI